MHILILGATGRNGSLILQEALQRNHTVTALVRNPESPNLPKNNNPNLTIVKGSPTSHPDILSAFTTPRTAHVVMTALAHTGTVGLPPPHNIFEQSMRAILAVVEEAKPVVKPKLIINSSQGVGSSWQSMNCICKVVFSQGALKIALDDHGQVDKLVRKSGLTFVSPRPCMLREGPRKEVHVWPEDGQGCSWWPTVTRESVVKWMVDAVETTEWDNKAPVITN